jgi:hypothetical protein
VDPGLRVRVGQPWSGGQDLLGRHPVHRRLCLAAGVFGLCISVHRAQARAPLAHLRVTRRSKNKLSQQSPGSVVTLSNVTDSHVSSDVKGKFKELADQTRGISKAAATVGLTGFQKAIAVLIRNDMFWADSVEEAQDWLAEQGKK